MICLARMLFIGLVMRSAHPSLARLSPREQAQEGSSGTRLAQPSNRVVIDGEVVGPRVPARPGETCIVCNNPVGPDDAVYLVPVSLGIEFESADPKSRSLEDDLSTMVQEEISISGRLAILPYGISHIGGDVLFQLAAPDLYFLAEVYGRSWCCFVTGVGGLPRIHGTAISIRLSFASSTGKSVIAIHQEVPGYLGLGVYEERQIKDLAIPEHVAAIPLTVQPLGRQANFI